METTAEFQIDTSTTAASKPDPQPPQQFVQITAEQYELFLRLQQQSQQPPQLIEPTRYNSPPRQQQRASVEVKSRSKSKKDLAQESEKSSEAFDWELPPSKWMPVEKVRHCWKDSRDFSIFVWKNHCRKCGRVFCSKCIRERTFDADGSRLLDPALIKKRERQLGRKLRVTKICEDCDQTFNTFEASVNRINQINKLTKQQASGYQRPQPKNSSTTVEQPAENPESKHNSNKRLKEHDKEEEQATCHGINPEILRTQFSKGGTQVREFIQLIEEEGDTSNVDSETSNNLVEFSHRHISKIVALALSAADIDLSKWHALIHEFVIKAVEQIKPSSKLLNDSMNLNDFVKIKLIPWMDTSRSQYINGVVITKNLADRRMLSQISNPNILLLKNTQDIGFTDLQSEIDQEDHLLKILGKKLEQISPQIVIVEENIPYKVMCMLRDEYKISVISNVTEKKLNRIARLTQTLIANGVAVLDKRFVLGKSQNFKVTNLSKQAREKGFTIQNFRFSTDALSTEEQNLTWIEGCNPALGSTILLSGPPSEAQELRTLKKIIRKLLVIARGIHAERYFLQSLRIDVPEPPAEEHIKFTADDLQGGYRDLIHKFRKTDLSSPFLITDSNEDRSVFYYKEFLVTLRTGHLTAAQDESPDYFHQTKIDEHYVNTKIDKVCGKYKRQRIAFYKQNQTQNYYTDDMTLGKYIESVVSGLCNDCRICESDMSRHAIELYHGDGCVQVLLCVNSLKKEQIKDQWNKNIMFTLRCKSCQSITKPQQVRTQLYEYSKARFLEQLFYNDMHYTLKETCLCPRKSIKQKYVFSFSLSTRVRVDFIYKKMDIYKIQLVHPKKFDTTSHNRLIIEQQCGQLEDNLALVVNIFQDRFQVLKSHLRLCRKMYGGKPDPSLEMLQTKLNQVEELTDKTTKNVMTLLNDALAEMKQITSVFAPFFLNRKLFLNLIGYQRLMQEIAKFTALLIVLCRRRDFVLTNAEEQQQCDVRATELPSWRKETILDDSVLGQNYSPTPPDSIALKTEPTTEQLKMTHVQRQQTETPLQLIQDVLMEECHSATLRSQFNQKNSPRRRWQTTSDMDDYSELKRLMKSSSGGHCFVDELNVMAKVTNKSLCPITYLPTGCCSNPNTIVQTYAQISDAVVEQMMVMQNHADDEAQSYTNAARGHTTIGGGVRIDTIEESTHFVSRTTQKPGEKDPKSSFVRQKPIISALNQPNEFGKLFQNLMSQVYNPYLTLPLGMDNIFIQVSTTDIGSIIAYALTTNVYVEGLSRLNYMGLESRVNHHHERNEIESVILIGKEDVLNYDPPNKNQLEHEMLQSSRIEFKVRFTTHCKDSSMRLREGKKDIVLTHAHQHFKTGQNIQATGKKKLNDMQARVLKDVNKDFLKNAQCVESFSELESLHAEVTNHYLDKDKRAKFKQHFQSAQNDLMLSNRQANQTLESIQNAALVEDDLAVGNVGKLDSSIIEPSGAEPKLIKPKYNGSKPRLDEKSMMQQQTSPLFDNTTGLFGLESPAKVICAEQQKGIVGIAEQLEAPMIEFSVKILFPKRFQALRRFYCGTHYDFIHSIMRVKPWKTSGGQQALPFYKSHDEKYVFKEVKKAEFKMFQEFGPTYFDYMVKAFFHNYPCALCKIFGAYAITIKSAQAPELQKKVYVFVMENLNLGITQKDEEHIVRYDLKGSELNRLVHTESQTQVTLLDSNFLLIQNGRPIVLHKRLANLLHICINNDSLCLSKTNIIDYSLLAIVNTKEKKIRFGIIDYLQMYTLVRQFETKFKKMINMGQDPTIIAPSAYRNRFIRHVQTYFVPVDHYKTKAPTFRSQEEYLQQISDAQSELEKLRDEDLEVEQSDRAVSPTPINSI